MPATEHTATPWTYERDRCRVCDLAGRGEFNILEIEAGEHAQFAEEADVKFIVEAVNAHESLLAQVRVLREALEICVEGMEFASGRTAYTLRQARAALAQCEVRKQSTEGL
jgi:hypothetical protein